MKTKVIDNRDDPRVQPQQLEFLTDWNPTSAYGFKKGERVELKPKELNNSAAEAFVKNGQARYVNGGPLADEKSEGVLVRDCPFDAAGDQLKASGLGADEVRLAVRKGWARVSDNAVQEATVQSAPPRP